eukprot:m.16533 g.16533  ORF g.16533 m.16533 type:complete len:369 (+) comp11082_c0_seq1:205-1311(+)
MALVQTYIAPFLAPLAWPAFAALLVCLVISLIVYNVRDVVDTKPTAKLLVPKSVNFHFTRECNYACGFCFHTAKDVHLLPIDKQFQGLKMLADAGMEKINFSGGEPFLKERGHRVGKLVRYCKQTLKLSSVSIVTNGSLVTETWFEEYGADLDILAVSCDSFVQKVNIQIGRHHKHKDHLKSLQRVRDWCGTHMVLFKLNTVVNAYNWDEDMSESLQALRPICRWKIFKVLPIEGENSPTTDARALNSDAKTRVASTSTSVEALRDVTPFLIAEEKFQAFLQRHHDGGLSDIMVPENNETMQNSYLILDERMRFLDCTSGAKTPSPSILDVDIDTALRFSGFDQEMFVQRKGEYAWTKPCASDPNMEW